MGEQNANITQQKEQTSVRGTASNDENAMRVLQSSRERSFGKSFRILSAFEMMG